jgi:hypothetical protein
MSRPMLVVDKIVLVVDNEKRAEAVRFALAVG